MYKHKLLLLLAWVLVVNAYGQMQQSKWFNFQPSSTTATSVSFSQSTLATATVPNNSLANYRGYNAAFDASGNMVFYVVAQSASAFVYNASGILVHTISFLSNPDAAIGTDYGSAEIPIIKIGCGLLYHFIIGDKIYRYNVETESVIEAIDNPNQDLGLGKVNISTGSYRIWNTSYAISKINEFKYGVYFLNGNKTGTSGTRFLEHVIIDANLLSGFPDILSSTNYDRISTTNISTIAVSGGNGSYPTAFNNYVSPLELSPTKNYIAFAEDKFIMVYNILSNGSIGTLKGTYEFESQSSSIDYKVAGLEFTPDGQKLYFTRFDGAGSVINNALGYINLATTTPVVTYVIGTSIYARSEIELGRDNNLYVTSPTKLVRINTTTNTLTDVLTMNFYPNNSLMSLIPNSLNFCTRILPDQIDGTNNSDGFVISFKNYTPPSNTTWNTTTTLPFPTSNGQINIGSTLTINAPLLITGMTLNFMEGGKLNIVAGGVLTLRGCTLKGIDCGKMWNGISVRNGGKLAINSNFNINSPNSTIPSKIYDALIAIDVAGNINNGLIVFQTEFERNEKHIVLDNCKTYPLTDIRFNTFSHKQPLKDQTRGVYDDMNDLKYGKTSVGISNVGGVNPIELDYCTFNGGQLGVAVFKAPVRVKNSNFNLMVNSFGTGVTVNQMNSGKNIEVTNCKFTTVQQAFVAAYCNKNILFNFNKVDYTTKNAVDVFACKNANITVKNNEFTYCSDNAIILTNNAGQTTADISANKMEGYSVYAPSSKRVCVGVSVIETGKPLSTNSYNGFTPTITGLQITNNTMNKMSYGIKMNGVAGGQRNNPTPANQTALNANNISYFSSTNKPRRPVDLNSGIQTYYCDGISFIGNNIAAGGLGQNKTWSNRGIHVEWTTKSLIKGDTIKAGRGISAVCDGWDNNYTCNVFNQNYDAISLGDHWMRANTDVHGVKNAQSRTNVFNNASHTHADIELYTITASKMPTYIAGNQWLFTAAKPNIKYNPTTASTIDAGIAPSICGEAASAPTIDSSQIGALPDVAASDTIIYWQWLYEYEKQQKKAGIHSNNFISKLIDVQAKFADAEYVIAQSILATMQPTNSLETHFITVYTILLNAQIPEYRKLDSIEVQALSTVAALWPQHAGPAVYVARGALWYQEGLDFITEANKNTPIVVKLDFAPCLPVLPIANIAAMLVSTNNIPFATDGIVIDSLGNAFVSPIYFDTLPADGAFAFKFIYNGIPYISNYFTTEQWMETPTQHINLCNMGKRANTTTAIQNEALVAKKIVIYPNPSAGVFTLPEMEEMENAMVLVYDVYGKLVHKATIESNELDLTDKADGLYYIRIETKTGVLLARQSVIIQH